MARVGMLDVSGDESRLSATGGTLRFDQQPEFRGAAGARRTHAFGQSDDGGGGGDCRAFYGHSELAIQLEKAWARKHATISQAYWRRCPARQSQCRHRSDYSEAISEAH